jgi:hypothetical protein
LGFPNIVSNNDDKRLVLKFERRCVITQAFADSMSPGGNAGSFSNLRGCARGFEYRGQGLD